MTLDTCTEAELRGMLAYEIAVELRRASLDRVARSRRKIARIEAELARRGVEVEELQVRGHAGVPRKTHAEP